MVDRGAEAPELEFVGAPALVGEEIATALADELDRLAAPGSSVSDDERFDLRELARELRMVGYMLSVCDRRDGPSLLARLEGYAWKSYVLVEAPAPGELTPPRGREFAARIVDVDFDEDTAVKRAKWDVKRSTNRVLTGSSDPPPPDNPWRLLRRDPVG